MLWWNWGDPNFVAQFSAWGQWASAFASLLAVSVALWVAHKSGKDSQEQSRQTRLDASRPILVMSGNDPIYEGGIKAFTIKDNRAGLYLRIHTQPGKKGWIDWNSSEQYLSLKNVGTGAAFHVMSVMFGPESLEDNGKLLDASKNDYWQHKINILSVGEIKGCQYNKPLQNLLKGDVDGYSFLAPSQPIIDPLDAKRMLYEDWVVCRVTTTYRDIFNRKHASIFDLDIRGFWIMRAILEDIPKDLYDLQKINALC